MSRITLVRTPAQTALPSARKLLRTLLTLVILPCSWASADTDHLYLEADGYVHFEAEDAGDTDAWNLRSDLKGYSGTGYLEWTGGNHFSEQEAGAGIISYHFRIETAGNYELRWRSRIAKGESNTESNDTWVRFATGSNVSGEQSLDGWTKVYMGEFGVWSWSARTVDQQAKPVRQFFTAGDHTVEISGRSNGHAIDRIALYRYTDVSFDPGLNGTLPLSRQLQEDGSVNDPNPLVVPEPEVVLSERINVTPIAVDSSQADAPFCASETLTLPALKVATLDTVEQTSHHDSAELTLDADRHSALLSFDLSTLPAFTDAELHYSNIGPVSNGSLNIYLASHNNWPDNDPDKAPDALVRVATAQGGWSAATRYRSRLDASLLPLETSTLLLVLETGADPLELWSVGDTSEAPQLVITGGEGFCANWDANVAESNSDKGSDTTDTADTSKRRSGSGSTTWWLLLILLPGLYRPYLMRR